MCSVAPESKTVKYEGCSVPEHPDILQASKNLMEKLWLEHRQCSFISPKIAHFTLFLIAKTFFLHEKTTIPNDLQLFFLTYFSGVHIFLFGG